MANILQDGFEASVRTKLGVKATELPDEDINQRMILDLAEATVIKRVPDYQLISDVAEEIYLENAVLSYMCYLLCPGMARRVNLEVTTIDVKWKKDKVRWEDLAQQFLAEFENSLLEITSVDVSTGYDSTLFGIAHGPYTTASGTT